MQALCDVANMYVFWSDRRKLVESGKLPYSRVSEHRRHVLTSSTVPPEVFDYVPLEAGRTLDGKMRRQWTPHHPLRLAR